MGVDSSARRIETTRPKTHRRQFLLLPAIVVLGVIFGLPLAALISFSFHEMTGPAQASDLEHVMPAALLTGCTSGPTPANALATLDCTAQKRKGLSFQVSLYPNTDDVISAYRAILGAQGIAQNSDGCSQASWRGEREWLHPTGSLGGRVACYLDPTGDSVIVWIHMSKNQQGVAPQSDHRDILGVARQHTQLPGELLAWWSFWSGVKGTANIIGKVH